MFIECREEVRVTHSGRVYLLEERRLFGYVYTVSDDLGKAAIATGVCRELKDYKGPAEIPSNTPLSEVSPNEPAAPPEAPPAPKVKPPASPKVKKTP